ncbi:MAG: sugar ABC transporter permease [Rhizobiales bacterium]|nr:sugar ABC transporter permease [Hyphomicrobiales bacterium]
MSTDAAAIEYPSQPEGYRPSRWSSIRAALLPYAFAAPAVLLVIAVTGYGTYYAFEYSLYEATITIKKNFVGLDNFRDIVEDVRRWWGWA